MLRPSLIADLLRSLLSLKQEIVRCGRPLPDNQKKQQPLSLQPIVLGTTNATTTALDDLDDEQEDDDDEDDDEEGKNKNKGL